MQLNKLEKKIRENSKHKQVKLRDSEIISLALATSLLIYSGCRHYQVNHPKIPDFDYEKNERYIKDLRRIKFGGYKI